MELLLEARGAALDLLFIQQLVQHLALAVAQLGAQGEGCVCVCVYVCVCVACECALFMVCACVCARSCTQIAMSKLSAYERAPSQCMRSSQQIQAQIDQHQQPRATLQEISCWKAALAGTHLVEQRRVRRHLLHRRPDLVKVLGDGQLVVPVGVEQTKVGVELLAVVARQLGADGVERDVERTPVRLEGRELLTCLVGACICALRVRVCACACVSSA